MPLLSSKPPLLVVGILRVHSVHLFFLVHVELFILSVVARLEWLILRLKCRVSFYDPRTPSLCRSQHWVLNFGDREELQCV